MNRGDVVLVRFPHPTGLRGKKRPALIVQSNAYSGTLSTVIIAEITKNLSMASNPACLFIDISSPDGKATGLARDSVVSSLLLATVYTDTVTQILGSLSPGMIKKLDDCLRAALAIS